MWPLLVKLLEEEVEPVALEQPGVHVREAVMVRGVKCPNPPVLQCTGVARVSDDIADLVVADLDPLCSQRTKPAPEVTRLAAGLDSQRNLSEAIEETQVKGSCFCTY